MVQKQAKQNSKKTICEHGFDNCSYKVIETLTYSNIKDLWTLEDIYIVKYNSITNGLNYRMNCHTDDL